MCYGGKVDKKKERKRKIKIRRVYRHDGRMDSLVKEKSRTKTPHKLMNKWRKNNNTYLSAFVDFDCYPYS